MSLQICDSVKETCFKPVGAFKDPCQHAVPHERTVDCLGCKCERMATMVKEPGAYNYRLTGWIYINHVPAKEERTEYAGKEAASS